EIGQGERDLEALKSTLIAKEQELDKAGRVTQVSDEELKTRQAKIEDLRGRLLQKLSIQTEIKNEAGRSEKELELILRQEEKLKSRTKEEQTLLSGKDEEVLTYEEELKHLQQKLEDNTAGIDQDKAAMESLSAELNDLRNKLTDMDKEKDGSLHHLHALEKIVEKERSKDIPENIPGSIGLLADLIEADSENTLLVDVFWKEEAKANLIAAETFLKNLPQEKLKGLYLLISSKKPNAFPPGLRRDSRVEGFLKACVRPDPKVKESFGQLQEAVIVPDVKTAVTLWLDYPDINCLTRNGDLLLSSGLLKLGPKKEGLIALGQEVKSIKEKIAGLEQKMQPLSAKLEEKSREKAQLEDQIQQGSMLRRNLEQTVADKEKEKKFSLTEKEKIESNITLFKGELSVLVEEKQEKSLNLEKLKEEVRSLENEEDDLKIEVGREEEELSRLRGKREETKNFYFELQSGVDILKEKINSTQGRILSLKQRIQATESKIVGLDRETKKLEEEKTRSQQLSSELGEKSSQLETEIGEREQSLSESEARLTQVQQEQQDMENRIEELRRIHEEKKEERVQQEIKKAQGDRDIANCEESCWQELKKTLDEVKKEVALEIIVDHDVEEELSDAKDKLDKLKAVNLMAEEEYLIQKERFDFLTDQRNDLRESIDTTQEAIRKIDQESKTQFLTALKEVNKNFQDVFAVLFEGGHAELKLTDPNQPLESGIDIIAQPPGKKVQSLSLLSGGEKTLTSLAFLFGLFRYKPTPFCILDEVDAALDEVNLGRFLKLMKKIKNQTQFIIITHNFKSMEVADYIYGTTMAEPNITSIYAMKLEKKDEEQA
ncbi:MAG: chromosome segregation protein SMC, partial [Candidatus Aminicenantes bacterium]|nr:chromosome segregation protein SMC [Candidatus Aminicenantes bacterium]